MSGEVAVDIAGSRVYKPLKVNLGAGYVIKPVKYWNGTAWVLTNSVVDPFNGFDLWDNFSINENPLNTAPTGQVPVFTPVTANWIAVDGYIYLQGGWDAEYVLWDLGSPEQYAETEFLSAAAANLYPGLVVRSPSTNSPYHYRVELNQASTVLSLIRVGVGGQFTINSTAGGVYTPGDTVGLEVKNNVDGNPVLKIFVNGVLILTHTDAAAEKILTGNYTGIRNGVAGTSELRYGSIRARNLNPVVTSGFGNNFANDFGGPAPVLLGYGYDYGNNYGGSA